MECRRLPVISKIRWDAAEEELTKAGVSTDVVKSLALLRLSHRTTSVDSDNDDDEETAKTIQQARQGELDAAAETGRAEDDAVLAALATAQHRARKKHRKEAAEALKQAEMTAVRADEDIRRSQERQNNAVMREDFDAARTAKAETNTLRKQRRVDAARSLATHDDVIHLSDRKASSSGKEGSVFCHRWVASPDTDLLLPDDDGDMFLDAQQLEKARERDAADAVADVAAAARVAARRRARDQSQRDVFDEDSYASSSESDDQASSDDENDQTIDPMATLKSPISGAQDWSYISEAAMPSSSDRGWWGFDEYPLETLKRPLDLDLSDDEDVARPPTPARLSEEEDARRDRARNHCERLLHTESVSSRLVRWMAHEGVADVDGVADALAQMHAVRLSPPSQPPGGLSVPPDDDDLSLFLYKSTSVRREAVSKALKAIIGPLALAFACQGNWLMRRQVLVLVRDGRSRIDTEALAEAAGILQWEEGWRRRRLLFAALCALLQQGLSSESADVFAEACRLLVDLFRGKKKRLDRNVSHSTIAESPTYQTIRSDIAEGDDDVLAPTTLLRRGICRKGAPLKDALAALRALLPLVCQRCARHCSDTDERSSHAASRRAARVAARCVSRLARTPWLGAPLIAAAVLPRPPPVGAHVIEETDSRRHAAAVLGHPSQPAKLAAARLRTLALLVARFGARDDSVLDARDIASLAEAVLRQDPRQEVCRAAASLIGALYAALVDAAAVARVSSGKDFSLVACNRDARRKLRRAFQNRTSSILSPSRKSGLVRYTDPETGHEYILDEKTGDSRWASADDWAIDAKMRNVGQEILRRRNILKAFGSPSIMPSETLADDLHTIADDDARLRRALARVDAEMARRHGSAPSVAAEAKRLKKAAARHAAARSNAASDAATAARKACQAAAEAVRSAVEACRVGRSGEKDDKTRRLEAILNAVCSRKLQVVWKAGFRVRTQAKYRVASRKAFEAAQAASDQAAASVAQLDIRNVKDQCSEFHANALDADKAAQAAQAALDAEKQKREAQQAAAKASSKPSGKVHPADAKPAPAKKKGWFGKGKKK
jgi:hypothetical protein